MRIIPHCGWHPGLGCAEWRQQSCGIPKRKKEANESYRQCVASIGAVDILQIAKVSRQIVLKEGVNLSLSLSLPLSLCAKAHVDSGSQIPHRNSGSSRCGLHWWGSRGQTGGEAQVRPEPTAHGVEMRYVKQSTKNNIAFEEREQSDERRRKTFIWCSNTAPWPSL